MRVLVVVDMLNAFAHKDGTLFCPDAEKVIPYVKEKVEEFINAGEQIVFLCDNHDEDDKEFEKFPKHAIANTWEADVIDELKFALEHPGVFWIPKTRYSGFYKTGLDEVIQNEGMENATFEIVGVCTGICDMDTIGDFANRDMKTAIHKNGVADLPSAAYIGEGLAMDLQAANISLQEIWSKRMSFLYGTEII